MQEKAEKKVEPVVVTESVATRTGAVIKTTGGAKKLKDLFD